MKRNTGKALAMPPLDTKQRYTIEEASIYLRVSVSTVYTYVRKYNLRIIKDGRLTFVPGSEIARLSDLPKDAKPAVPLVQAG